MEIRVILARPEYQVNLGAVARAMKNFGVADLVLVRPKVKIGFTARMYAKHSEEVLQKAKKAKSIADAAKDCDVIVGTTAALDRFRGMVKNCVTIAEAKKLAKGKKVALVFGSEGNGLSEKELEECDILAHIPAAGPHPVLNLSHAVAVALYEFTRPSKEQYFAYAPVKTRRVLEKMFGRIVQKQERVRDKRKVSLAFRRVLERGNVADDEAQALLAAFSSILKTSRSRN